MGNHITVCRQQTERQEIATIIPYGQVVRISGNTFVKQQLHFTDSASELNTLYILKNQKQHRYLLNLVRIDQTETNSLCSSIRIIAAIYQFSAKNLQSQIEQRYRRRLSFHQDDIWSILMATTQAGLQMHKKFIELTTEKVMMIDGRLKIINPIMEEMIPIVDETTLLPPERRHHKGKRIIDEGWYVYSMGMVLLSVMYLRDLWKDEQLLGSHFSQRLQKIVTRCANLYSCHLVKTVLKMLHPEFTKRIRLSELKKLQNQPQQVNILNIETIRHPTVVPHILQPASYIPSKPPLQPHHVHNTMVIVPLQQNHTPTFTPVVNSGNSSKTGSQNPSLSKIQSLKHIGSQQGTLLQQKFLTSPNRPSTILPLQPKKTQSDLNISAQFSQIERSPSQNHFATFNSSMICQPLAPQNLNSTIFQRSSISRPASTKRSVKASMVNSRGQENSKVSVVLQKHQRITMPNGNLYQGYTINNQYEGFGILYQKQGGNPLYQGHWRQNKYDGDGILYNVQPQQINRSFDFQDMNKLEKCWLYYRGSFKNGHKTGRGTIFLTNGQYYVGQWNQDLPNGEGQFHNMDGKVVNGAWKHGIFIHE